MIRMACSKKRQRDRRWKKKKVSAWIQIVYSFRSRTFLPWPHCHVTAKLWGMSIWEILNICISIGLNSYSQTASSQLSYFCQSFQYSLPDLKQQLSYFCYSLSVPKPNYYAQVLLLLLLLSHVSSVWLCATPETAAHQAPPSLGFSR